MPAPSPANVNDATLSFTIKVNGSAISDLYPVVSVTTNNELNKIPTAEIVLVDGSVETGEFPISDSSDFAPGSTIEITAGYMGDSEASIFKGVVVKHAVKISSTSEMNLVVTCKHKAVVTTFNKKEAFFNDKTDSAIISAIASTHGLSVTVDSTSVVQEASFQKLATDWDFILARADFCGFVVAFDGDDIKIGKPSFTGSAVLGVVLGDSIYTFNAELNAEKQAPKLEATSWDMKTQAMITSDAAEPSLNTHGNLTAKKLADALSQTDVHLHSGAPMTQDALKLWADASLLRMRMSALKGRVSFMGSALITPGKILELSGVGERFNGSAYVSAVQHTIEEGTWTTEVKFGFDARPISEQADFSYSPAAGQLPAIHGLQVATVKKLFDDPESQSRILVTLTASATPGKGVWARMGNFYATGSAGSAFLPEVGDEVVVGFLENNPTSPVILGSLYSSTKKSAYPAADDNNYIKAITTKSKLKISFDDEKKITKIETPGGNSITLDDDGKAIDLVDQNGNSIKMTSSGIVIQSGKDITLKATGAVKLEATGKVDIKATQDAAIAGMNVTATAQMGFTAKGNATAELSASGQTTVKGGIVMIN